MTKGWPIYIYCLIILIEHDLHDFIIRNLMYGYWCKWLGSNPVIYYHIYVVIEDIYNFATTKHDKVLSVHLNLALWRDYPVKRQSKVVYHDQSKSQTILKTPRYIANELKIHFTNVVDEFTQTCIWVLLFWFIGKRFSSVWGTLLILTIYTSFLWSRFLAYLTFKILFLI